VRAIIAMCQGLDLAVVAEGIEEQADVDMLRALGCGMGQGYHYGRPVDGAATLRYLQDHYHDFMAIERI
jgi:EAL domain-containing protein (putative c-di-GMP-specific phosphodiesterase class I)